MVDPCIFDSVKLFLRVTYTNVIRNIKQIEYSCFDMFKKSKTLINSCSTNSYFHGKQRYSTTLVTLVETVTSITSVTSASLITFFVPVSAVPNVSSF